MKILLTGGAGFIGSNIADAYIKAGHSVWVVDNESTGNRENVNPHAYYQQLDIVHKQALEHLFEQTRFDIINHHAAQIDVRRSVADPHFDCAVNITGTLNLLELARQYKVKKIIFSSSGGTVYGECRKPATELNPTEPHCPYGVSKLAAEKYIKTYNENHGLRYTIFRYGNVYGPRQDPYGEAGVVAIFSKLLLEGKKAIIFGNGKQTRDFVFVGDVVRANLLALNSGHNQVINIGTQKETSVNQLFQAMAKIVGYQKPAVKKPARTGELQRSVLNIQLAKKILRWTPQRSIEEGLRETIDYFRSARNA